MQLDEVALVVAGWAASIPNVKAAYLFGSRAKGTSRVDSDLDVAIALEGDDEGFADWICDAEELRNALGALLPMPLDLRMMHSGDTTVMPAVQEHGLQVFKRSDL
jgi:predicted nucleotidyltransferase